MKTDSKKLFVALLLVFLLSLLGAALFATHAAPLDNSGVSELATASQACYTLDTSRPEWLQTSPFVYLPLVLKNNAP
jgi:hypothetical protein